jgi:RNA polymerase sigma-70 factor (ECF subfamily)
MNDTDFLVLLDRARCDDKAAWNRLARWITDYLEGRRPFHPPLGGGAGHSDLVQESLKCAFLALRNFDGTTLPQFRAWLREILENHYRMYFRRIKPTVPIVEGMDVPAADPTPSAQLRDREGQEQLTAAVANLPPDLRTIWELRTQGNLTNDAIGEQVGVDASTVSRKLERCKQLLRRALGRTS